MSNVVLCRVYAVLYLHNSHCDRGKETSMRTTGQAWSSDMVIAVSNNSQEAGYSYGEWMMQPWKGMKRLRDR